MIRKTINFIIQATVLSGCLMCAASGQQTVNFDPGQPTMEVVGQVQNFATTPQASLQYGYVSHVEGLDPVFGGHPQNESTARLTFVTQATTVRVISNGTLKVINRTGSTTIYLNLSGADFSNPASFSSGTPIQTSTFRQQVVLDPAAGIFSVVNFNTITATSIFTLNSSDFRLGRRGQSFRTTLYGRLNTLGTVPTGYFAGFAVGVRHDEADRNQE